jgi:acyl-CoA thioesterase-1
MSNDNFMVMMVRIFIVCLLIFASSCERPSPLKSGKGAHFIQLLEQGERVKIVTLGTSLTGGTWRWVDVMEEWLNEAYPGLVSIENLGVGASASMTVPLMEGNPYTWKKCGLDRIPEAIAAKPDVVFIEFAVNDAYVAYNISLQESRRNLESMIHSLTEANAELEIIIQTMNVVIDMPENESKASSDRPELPKYVKMNEKVAKRHNLLLIDHYSNWKKFLKNEGRQEYIKVVRDGVHPNLDGYRLILLPELKKTLKQ